MNISTRLLVLLLAITSMPTFAFAAPATRLPIVEYADPTENPDFSDEDAESMLKHWLVCMECSATDVERLAGLGEQILRSLEKGLKGNTDFLEIERLRRSAGESYDGFAAFLTLPVNKQVFVNTEVENAVRLASERAREVLVEINTPAAQAILRSNRRRTDAN